MKPVRVMVMMLLTVVTGCAPLPAYRSPIEMFGTQTKALVEAVDKELAVFTDNQRIDYARFDVRRRIDIQRNVGRNGPQPSSYAVSSEDKRLCVPRDRVSEKAVSGKYLIAVSGALTATVAAPFEDITKLLRALMTSYTISVPHPERKEESVCRDDLGNYGANAYPGGEPEFAVAGLVEEVEALWAVFKPVLTTALQQADSARKAAAIKEFANDATNVRQIKQAVSDSVTTLTSASKRARYLAVSEFMSARDDFNEELRKFGVRKEESCSQYLASGVTSRDAPRDRHFRACYKAVWSASESKIASMVAAGKTYDKAAATDPTNAGKSLLQVTERLADSAAGKVDGAVASEMFQALADLYGLVEATNKDLHDAESQKKISEAVGLIRKSL